jgi:hypothetical protein
VIRSTGLQGASTCYPRSQPGQGEDHLGDQVAEGRPRGPERSDQPQHQPAQLGRGKSSHSGVLGRLDAHDDDSGRDEPRRQGQVATATCGGAGVAAHRQGVALVGSSARAPPNQRGVE